MEMDSAVELVEKLESEMVRTAENPTESAVHDLRVSVRRATEALRIFEGRIPRARRLRKEIKLIRECAATVRDRDVTRRLLRRHALPPADPALVYLQGQRDLAAQQLQSFLNNLLRADRPRRWRKWIGDSE